MNEISDDVETLADDASALLDSTSSAVGQRYDESRKALAAVLERGKNIYGITRKRAARDTRAADGIMRDNLYQTILVGIGVGALLGYIIARQSTCIHD